MRLAQRWKMPVLLVGGLAGGLVVGSAAAQAAGGSMPDAQVEANVLRQLASAPELSAQNIQTTTVYGTVTLTGNVHDEAMRSKAENLAARAQGVKKVVDQLTLGDTPAPAGDQYAQNGDPVQGQQPNGYSPNGPDNGSTGNGNQGNGSQWNQGNVPPVGQNGYPVQPGYAGAPEYAGNAPAQPNNGSQPAYPPNSLGTRDNRSIPRSPDIRPNSLGTVTSELMGIRLLQRRVRGIRRGDASRCTAMVPRLILRAARQVGRP